MFKNVTILLAALLAWASLLPAAAAEEASPWAAGHQSRARLIAGGPPDNGGDILTGVQIELAPQFKTYWRNPGDSGIPPVFDWSASVNAERIEVLWPAPQRLEDAAGVSYGYKGGVVFPVRVKAKDPNQPVKLALSLTYGVCKDICIPADAQMVLADARAGVGVHEPLITRALSQVPQMQPLGADAELSILGVEVAEVEGRSQLVGRVRAPAGAQLFVEAPEGWFVAAAPLAEGRFRLEVADRPRDAQGPVTIRLTLVAGDRAVESTATVDAARLPL